MACRHLCWYRLLATNRRSSYLALYFHPYHLLRHTFHWRCHCSNRYGTRRKRRTTGIMGSLCHTISIGISRHGYCLTCRIKCRTLLKNTICFTRCRNLQLMPPYDLDYQSSDSEEWMQILFASHILSPHYSIVIHLIVS